MSKRINSKIHRTITPNFNSPSEMDIISLGMQENMLFLTFLEIEFGFI